MINFLDVDSKEIGGRVAITDKPLEKQYQEKYRIFLGRSDGCGAESWNFPNNLSKEENQRKS